MAGEQDPAGFELRHIPAPALVLDGAGRVLEGNDGACDLLGLQSPPVGEPMLQWIPRASEREAFGRAFRGPQEADGFVLRASVRGSGADVECVLRSRGLADGRVLLLCLPDGGQRAEVEGDVGRAVLAGLAALEQGLCLLDDEGRIVHTNGAAQRLLGRTPLGRSLLEFADASDSAALARGLTLGRRAGWQGELMLRRMDGERVAVELSVAPAGGGPTVVVLRDVAERRRREFEERLVAQVDRCLLSDVEPRRSVSAALVALANGVGAPEVRLAVRTAAVWERWAVRGERPLDPVVLPSDVAPPDAWSDQTAPQVLDAPDPESDVIFGRPPKGGGSCLRCVMRAPSGVVGHMMVVRPAGAQWAQEEVALAGRIASQIALGLANGLLSLEARSLASYQAMVLDQTTVLIGSVDAEGRVVTWNRAAERVLGVDSNTALGQRMGREVATATDPQSWDALWERLLGEGSAAARVALQAADGETVPLHLEGRRLEERGVMRGAVLVGLDLREREALEQQITRSQKLAAVGLLAAGIAHEINNPLSGVVGYSQLLLEKKLAPDVRERVEKIAHSAERCRKIVEGVLLFARQREGAAHAVVDLGELISQVIAIGEYQWKMHNVRVLWEPGDATLRSFGDGQRLEQVLLNLLSNAVDAMPRGGTVRVELAPRDEKHAQIVVADAGEGIPPEVMDRIFDPFFSTKDIGKGTGLGLAISYGIVQDHGGDILVASKAGEGTTFTVVLPVHSLDPDDS